MKIPAVVKALLGDIARSVVNMFRHHVLHSLLFMFIGHIYQEMPEECGFVA